MKNSTPTSNVLTDLARQITEARLARNWTQQQLAEAAGMTQSAIARLESGGDSASYQTLQRVADALGSALIIQPVQTRPASRISREDWKIMRAIIRFRAEYHQEYPNDPSLNEIAVHLDLPITRVEECVQVMNLGLTPD